MGKRNLENAIVSAKAQFPQAEFEVNWRPFQLDPNASKEGINKLQHYNKKFGEERIKMMLPRMMETFAKVGLPYSMGGLTGNTFDSHRLIYFAAAKGGPALQDALVEELFKNYFCEEKYIGDRGVLLQAAITAGLDKAEAERVLDDPSAYAKEVNDEKKAFGRGVSGVPFFIINKEEGLSGAQPAETFIEIFQELLKA